MTTLDLVDYYGGEPANFLDIGGGAKAERVANALDMVFSDENVDAVVFNIFGGITRGDEVANGINEALERSTRSRSRSSSDSQGPTQRREWKS